MENGEAIKYKKKVETSYLKVACDFFLPLVALDGRSDKVAGKENKVK